LGFSWLAWLVPIPWLVLVTVYPVPAAASGGGLRFPMGGLYGQIWLGAGLPWLALLEGIRRAHVANNLGWIALSLYVAAYFPAFVALARSAVHGARVPLMLAAPVRLWSELPDRACVGLYRAVMA
jgi:hypothetical protein